jgi:hypothetical protein
MTVRANVATSRRAQAMACDDSSAGRMPSKRASAWNASSASASEAHAYSARPDRLQPRVLGSDGRVVEPGRHRVGRLDVAVGVLQHERARPLQHADRAAGKARRMASRDDPVPARLDADQPHALDRR